MSTHAAPEPWPSLDYGEIRPTVEHLHRLAQIGGKYTLGEPFEPNWGNVLMTITPRGFATPELRAGDVVFTVDYELLDDRVTITASTGRASLPLAPGSVADFYARFVEAAEPLGIGPLPTLGQPEIPDAPPLDEDREQRPYDPDVARRVWSAEASANRALVAYQAPFRAHRPRTGLWWGGFDLSAARFNGRPVTPPASHPVFMQNGMTGEVVSVGFVLGDQRSPVPGFYAYISPPPEGLGDADFGVPEAAWVPDAGLIFLPYDAVRSTDDPEATVVRFADAVYALAVERGGWPDDLVGERHDGWYASRHPVFGAAG
jgi:Family of unknown function (DUF5996)